MKVESTDQLGRKVDLNAYPQRIVSLVPSQTELLFSLGLGDRVVGITKFCIHPESWYRSKKRVGGTKNVAYEKVKELQPDLIIANKEENTKEDLEQLTAIAPVWISDIFNLSDSYEMMTRLGKLLAVESQAKALVEKCKKRFGALKSHRLEKSFSVLYLIWRNPYMGVAKNTFIDTILTEELGFSNLLADKERYPKVDLVQLDSPDFVFLSSEPYPFREKHFKEIESMFPKSKIMLVDGEYFSWYGSRLVHAPSYFESVLDEVNKSLEAE